MSTGRGVPASSLTINRAPVLTLWATVVAERLGHSRATALTLGKAVAGLNAQAKGRRLGIYEPAVKPEATRRPAARKAQVIALMGRSIPTITTPAGPRAVVKDAPISPESVERYLEQKFGDSLDAATAAMRVLARAYPPAKLAVEAYGLYERFRPRIPEGTRGWGAKGVLDLARLRDMGPR